LAETQLWTNLLTTNRDLFNVITTAHLLRMKSADMDTIELLLPPPSLKRIMKPMFCI
jgi:hypothetical protein